MDVIEVETQRLMLSPVAEGDVDELHAVFSDRATWAHLPAGRHRERAETESMIRRYLESWSIHGLGPWVPRLRYSLESRPAPGSGRDPEILAAGSAIGIAGVSWSPQGFWNLGYRLAPRAWGLGLATEASAPALDAARQVGQDAPITARVLEHNPASIRVLEHLGLELVWRGTSGAPPGSVTHGMGRRIYADRALEDDLLHHLIALG